MNIFIVSVCAYVIWQLIIFVTAYTAEKDHDRDVIVEFIQDLRDWERN